jgi:hypothetical protein
MLAGTGSMYDTLRLAGPSATDDVRRQVPPMYAMARIAAAFRPLPPFVRGVAAGAVTVAAMASAIGLGRRAVTRRPSAYPPSRRPRMRSSRPVAWPTSIR